MPISSTRLSCPLLGKAYVTSPVGSAFDPGEWARIYSTLTPSASVFPLPYTPRPQALQIAGRLFHPPLPPLLPRELRCSRAPSLPGHYSGSPLLRAHPPPSRRQPPSRFSRLYDLPCSIDFAMGRGRFLQLLGLPLSPCCP